MKRQSSFVFPIALLLVAMAGCGPARRTDHIPPELAAKYCDDPKAAFDIGLYLASRSLPLVQPDKIDECPEKKRGPAEAGYRAGIARGQAEVKCNPKKAQEDGLQDALAQKPANPAAYCDFGELRGAYENAYRAGYGTGTAQLCDATVGTAKDAGKTDGLAGTRKFSIDSVIKRCPEDRQKEVRTAYAMGVAAGEESACRDEIVWVAEEGRKIGYEGKQPLPPAMKRCPQPQLVEFRAAFAKGVAAGQEAACQDELAGAETQGKSDGFANKQPLVPVMRRCPQPKLTDLQSAYSKGFADGKRKACQDDMARAATQGGSDADAGKAPNPPAMMRCPPEAAQAFGQGYLVAYNQRKEQRMIAACPKENEAFERGVNDGRSGTPAASIPMASECTGQYRDRATAAYQKGTAEGLRQRQEQINEQERRRQQAIAEEQLRQQQLQTQRDYEIQQRKIQSDKEAAIAAAGATTPPAPPPSALGANGRNATVVAFGQSGRKLGEFRQSGPRQWVETNAAGSVTFRFQETNRDDWSVYLVDQSRNVSIQLDLHTRKVMYSDANSPRRALYDIMAAGAAPVR